MYDISVICSYKKDYIFFDTDELTCDDKQFIRDVIYRQELCNIFKLEEYDSGSIDEEIINIYSKIKSHEEFYKCIKEASNKFIFKDDDLMGLTILYSYDYMDLAHDCVSEFLKTNTISQIKIDKLKNALEEK
jgi:hypothetical protein